MSEPHTAGTLLLSRDDIRSLLSLDDCIEAVERVFKSYGEGKVSPPGILGMHAGDGGFHIKAGFLDTGKSYFAAKLNANFPGNPKQFGFPSIQGLILLSDAANGTPLAVMDSVEITIKRTGAATAIAAKHLSRVGSKIVTICGCGNQGMIQLRSLSRVRKIEKVFVYDKETDRVRTFADEFSSELTVVPITADELASSIRRSDICVTCTPARNYYVNRDDVASGTFVAAVGADSEDKQEIDPKLFRSSKIVVDVLTQCATIGDLHHALDEGVVNREDVHAELGEVVAGVKTGRENEEEIIIFDSTGMALQDAAAAVLVYEKALKRRANSFFKFS